MKIADEYYVLVLDDNIDYFIPLLNSKERVHYLMRRPLLDNITQVNMYLDPFVKDTSLLVDYFGITPVFSQKVSKVFEGLNLPYLQIVPVNLKVNENEEVLYKYVRVCNYIRCINPEKSDCKVRPETKTLTSIRSIVIDDDDLKKIKLQDRLLFRADKAGSIWLFHETVVDKILKIDTKGIAFRKVEEWHENDQFA